MPADHPSPLGIAVIVVFFLGLVVFALFFYRGYEYFAKRSLLRRFADLHIHGEMQAGDVVLQYHTYHGFLAWVTQTTHRVYLPPDEARQLVARLMRFNLMWGLVTYGALFIPPLAIINYFGQLRAIEYQESNPSLLPQLPSALSGAPQPHPSVEVSPFQRFLGWICVGLCMIFGVTAIVCVSSREYDTAIGGAVISALLGWMAYGWVVRAK